MKNSFKYRLISCVFLCIFSFAFVSCSENLFGSSSGGESCSSDIECLRISAEEMFRAGEYDKAYDLYGRIVQADPKASVGYYGMAKAGMWRRMNPFGIAGLARTRDDSSIPFVSDPTSEKNIYYQAMKDVFRSLDKLERRDSLTAIYEVYMVYMEEGLDKAKSRAGGKIGDDASFDSRLKKFGAEFCGGGKDCRDNIADTSASRRGLFEEFPLSDRKYKRNSYIAGFSISKFLYELLKFMDINSDGCLSSRNEDIYKSSDRTLADTLAARKKYGCESINEKLKHDLDLTFISWDDGVKIDLDAAYGMLVDNEGVADMLNDRIDDLYNGLGDIGSLIGSIGTNLWETAGGDTLGLDFDLGALGEVQEQIQENVDLYKDYLFFYKLNDGIDNDADGCIDESLIGFDTDGDGLVGEDMRLVHIDVRMSCSALPTNCWFSCSGKTISQDGKEYSQKWCFKAKENYTLYKGTEDPFEMSGYVMYLTENPVAHGDTILRLKFADTNFNPNYWITGDMDIKLKVQTEKDDGKTRCYNLQERKDLMGGCWVNYSAQDFIEYRRKQKDMNPDCRTVY